MFDKSSLHLVLLLGDPIKHTGEIPQAIQQFLTLLPNTHSSAYLTLVDGQSGDIATKFLKKATFTDANLVGVSGSSSRSNLLLEETEAVAASGAV